MYKVLSSPIPIKFFLVNILYVSQPLIPVYLRDAVCSWDSYSYFPLSLLPRCADMTDKFPISLIF